MNWLLFIIAVAIIGGLVGYFFSGGKRENAAMGVAAGAYIGGYFVFYILCALLFFYLILKIGGCLFN